MTDVFKGIVAGATATAAVSGLMLLQAAAGLMPQLSPVPLLLTLIEAPGEHVFGWALHFAIGSALFGAAFAYVEPRLGVDTHTKAGLLYGVILWLLMMLLFLPAAGVGYFGFQVSRLAPLILLGLHVVYGSVLGWVYGKLSPLHPPFTRHHPA